MRLGRCSPGGRFTAWTSPGRRLPSSRPRARKCRRGGHGCGSCSKRRSTSSGGVAAGGTGESGRPGRAVVGAWARMPNGRRRPRTLDALQAVDRNANLAILVDAWTAVLEDPRLSRPPDRPGSRPSPRPSPRRAPCRPERRGTAVLLLDRFFGSCVSILGRGRVVARGTPSRFGMRRSAMTGTIGMAEGRAGGIFASSFVAGSLLAVAICGRRLGASGPLLRARRTGGRARAADARRARELPPARSVAGTELRPPPLPERSPWPTLPAAIAAAVTSQALPTGGRTGRRRRSPREAGQSPGAGGATHLVPTLADLAASFPTSSTGVSIPARSRPRRQLIAGPGRAASAPPAADGRARAGTADGLAPAAARRDGRGAHRCRGTWTDPDAVNWTASPAEGAARAAAGSWLRRRSVEGRAERGAAQKPPTPG